MITCFSDLKTSSLFHLSFSVIVFDRAVLLNEMARMFLYFGDRSSAVSSYMKSAEIVLPLKDGENIHQRFKPLLVRHY